MMGAGPVAAVFLVLVVFAWIGWTQRRIDVMRLELDALHEITRELAARSDRIAGDQTKIMLLLHTLEIWFNALEEK